jgi:hypothetical protein
MRRNLHSEFLTPRRKGAEKYKFDAHSLTLSSAPLRLCASILLCVGLGAASAYSAEIDPIRIALLVDGMASRGSGFDAAELHALGTDGLAGVLNHLLPDTAPPAPPIKPETPEADVRRLIARLDADDFRAREQATQELIFRARGRRALIEAAAQSDSLEVRLRAERVLATWESRPAERLSAYLSGFWTYVEGLSDPERLELLARRTMKAFDQGMPEGDRLHLLRLCIAGVAHGRNDESCNILRPLIAHQDVRIATLVTETVGAYKTEPRFVPLLLVDALANDRQQVAEAALRFVLGAQDDKRRRPIQSALRAIFESGPEGLKFQACLPLIRDFQDADAWIYVLDQTTSQDANRVRTAFNWIGDTKNCGQQPAGNFLKQLERSLADQGASQRRATVAVLGTFAGEAVVRKLITLLANNDQNVARQAESSLLGQPDRELVRRLLAESVAIGRDAAFQSHAQSLLTKLAQP